MAKDKIYAVIGLGTFGNKVCEVLSDNGAKVIAIDNQPELIEKVKDMVTQAILLDSTDEEALSNAPFDDVDVAIVGIGENLEASIITTALLKRIGVPYILSRSISDIHQQVLTQIGADEIVNIEVDEGRRVAMRLLAPEVLETMPISQNISIAEIYVPKQFVGKSLRQIDFRNKFHLNVVSIKRSLLSVDELGNPIKSEDVIFPEPDDTLEEADVLLVVGNNADIDSFKE